MCRATTGSFYAFVAYPIDLFEEGSVVNVLTSLVGNVFGFRPCVICAWKTSASRSPTSRPAAVRRPGIQLERDRLNKSTAVRCSAPPSSRSSGLSAKNYGRAVL